MTKPSFPLRFAYEPDNRVPIDPELRPVGFAPGMIITAGELDTLFYEQGEWGVYFDSKLDEILAYDFRRWTCPDDSDFFVEWSGPGVNDGQLNVGASAVAIVNDVLGGEDSRLLWTGEAKFTQSIGVGDIDFVDSALSVTRREFFQVFPVQSPVFVKSGATVEAQSSGALKVTVSSSGSGPDVIIPLGSLNAVVTEESEAFLSNGGPGPYNEQMPQVWVEDGGSPGSTSDTMKFEVEAVAGDGSTVILAGFEFDAFDLDDGSPGWFTLDPVIADPWKVPSGCGLRLRISRSGFTGVFATVGAVKVRYATSKVR